MTTLHPTADLHGLEIDVRQPAEGAPCTHELSVTNSSSRPIQAGRVAVASDLVVDRFVEHGYQSWSTVRPTVPGDRRPVRAEAPRWFRNQMQQIGDAAGSLLCADLILIHDDGILATTWLDGPPVTMVVDADGRVSLSVDLEGVVLQPGERRPLARLLSADGAPGPLLSTWAEATGAMAGARTATPAPVGWCSWYQYFTEVTAADIRANLSHCVDHGLGLVQIDDGWQPSIGEWTGTAHRFGAPIGDLADEIRQRGLSAGIWTAPFLAIEGGPLASQHPDWLVRNEAGAPRTALHHEGWGGKVFALDLSQEAVVDHIAEQFRWLAACGFDYFKIDFLHAGVVPGARVGDGAIGRTAAFRSALAAIRTAIGEESTLLGCGSPLGPAVGLVDAMRVSEDVAPHWGPGAHFPGWEESSVGARNAIEASLRRAPFHRRWFANDPDCALLRPSDTDLSIGDRATLVATIAGTGGFTMLSDDLARYGPAEWDTVEALRVVQPICDVAVEVVDPMAASLLVVDGPDHHLVVDLDRRRASLEGPGIPTVLSGTR